MSKHYYRLTPDYGWREVDNNGNNKPNKPWALVVLADNLEEAFQKARKAHSEVPNWKAD